MGGTVHIDTYVYINPEEIYNRSSSPQNQIHLRGVYKGTKSPSARFLFNLTEGQKYHFT